MRTSRRLVLISIAAGFLPLPVHAEPLVGIDKFFFYGLEYPGKPHAFVLTMFSTATTVSASVALEPFMEYRPNDNLTLPLSDELTLDIREGDTTLTTLNVKRSGEHLTIESGCRKLKDDHTVYPYYPFASYIPPETITYRCVTALGAVEVRFICHGATNCWQEVS